MSEEPGSDFTCVDGGCHNFQLLEKFPRKRGSKTWLLVMFFYCTKCLKEMESSRPEMCDDAPDWWLQAKAENKKKTSVLKENFV